MAYPAEKIQDILQARIPQAQVLVQDLTGTQDHYKVVVISDDFLEKTLVERHQIVYKALGEPMTGPIHALTIEAYTEQAWLAREATRAHKL